MFINSDLYLFLRYWLTNKVNIKRPSTGLLMYTMATRFCDEIHLYGFWPFPKDASGNPVKYHYYDMLKYRYFSNASPHRMPLEFKTLKTLHSKGALKLTTSKCKPTWMVSHLKKRQTMQLSDRKAHSNPLKLNWTCLQLDISQALSAELKMLQRALSCFSNSISQFTGEL